MVARLLVVVAAALVLALQFLDPGVGPVEKPLSSYALGRYEAIWAVAVMSAGVAMLIQAWRWQQTARRRLGPGALFTAGGAFILVGAFSTDPWYPWQHALTWTGWIHVGATTIAMTSIAAAMLCEIIGPDRAAEGSLRAISGAYILVLLLTGCITLAFLILGKEPPLIGLEERVLIVIAFLWLALK